MLAGLQVGRYGAVVNQVDITDKRKEIFDFSEPYTLSSPQLIVRKGETRSFKTLADLKDKKLGLGQGTNFADVSQGGGWNRYQNLTRLPGIPARPGTRLN